MDSMIEPEPSSGLAGTGPNPDAAAALTDSRFATLLRHVSDIIAVYAADGRLVYVSPSVERVLGLGGFDAFGPDIAARVHIEDVDALRDAFRAWATGPPDATGDQVEYRVRGSRGEWRFMQSTGANLLDDPSVQGVVVTARDITEQRVAQMELSYQAVHDALTGLPNRTLLYDRIEQALAGRARRRTSVVVLFIDLDRFKLVNDTFGHAAGDNILLAVTDLLTGTARFEDTIARLGGDEFVICGEVTGEDDAILLAERVCAVLRGSFGVAGQEVYLTGSVGVVVMPPGSRMLAATAVRDAEVAMYRAKEAARGGYALFDLASHARVVERFSVEAALRRAIAQGELRLFYQPQVRMDTGKVVGFEALLRWDHPERGLLDPSTFLNIAEETGLIAPIGAWVLREACRDAVSWREARPEQRISVSVNLSAGQLSDRDLPSMVSAVLAATTLEPAQLCLEITESMLMEDAPAAASTLRSLKALGIKLAIDDFGTGYSSLAYLKRFPVDLLKVDQSFVAGLGRDHEDFAIVDAVLNLARSLGLDALAEGVENQRHLAELQRLGCALAQGYLWSPPVPAASVLPILDRPPTPGAAMAIGPVERPPRTSSSSIDIISTLTHELRTPLTVIRAYTEAVQGALAVDDRDTLLRGVAAIERNAQTMDGIIKTLADAEALESGNLVLEASVVDLDSLVVDLVESSAAVVGDHTVRSSGKGGVVWGDTVRLQQIVMNLVANAAKFSPDGEPIRIELDQGGPGGGVRLSVIDRGPGIPPELVGDIFRKFYRHDRTVKGTGLGLYLSRSLARAHGGELTCHRADTGGAELRLVLPSYDPDVMSRREPNPASGRTAGTAADADAFALVADAASALPQVTCAEEAVGACISLVVALGGTTVPARSADPSAMGIDVSFGQGEALLAAAEPSSAARASIEALLPRFVENARAAARAAGDRESTAEDPCTDHLTGLPCGEAFEASMSELGLGSSLLVIEMGEMGGAGEIYSRGPAVGEVARQDALRSLARTLRGFCQPGDVLGRLDGDRLALAMAGTTADEATQRSGSIEARWLQVRPGPAELAVEVELL